MQRKDTRNDRSRRQPTHPHLWVVGAADPPPRRTIVGIGCQLSQVTEEAWNALLEWDTPPTFFRHGVELVRVHEIEPEGRDEHDLPYVVCPQSVATLLGPMSRAAAWVNPAGRAIPPNKGALTAMAHEPDKRVPSLGRIVTTPVYGRNGTLILEPGYDPAERILYMQTAAELHLSVPARPTKADMRRAVGLIDREVLGDFGLDAASRAHAYTAMMQTMCRGLYRGPSPLHAVTSEIRGAGKGLLVDTTSRIVTGRPPYSCTMNFGRGGESEVRRTLTSVLRATPEVLLVDNVSSVMDSAALASTLTSTSSVDRVMGTSTAPPLPNYALWFATGNSLRFSAELSRRVALIELDPGTSSPETRTGFRHADLRGWVMEHRAPLLSALYTIVAGWIRAGRRPCTSVTLGSYEGWVRTMGGILQYAGIDGLLVNRDCVRVNEPEEEELATIVSAWRRNHEERWVRVDDLLGTLANNRVSLPFVAGRSRASQRSGLGKWLSARAGRVVDGLRIARQSDRHTDSARYRLCEVRS